MSTCDVPLGSPGSRVNSSPHVQLSSASLKSSSFSWYETMAEEEDKMSEGRVVQYESLVNREYYIPDRGKK